MPALSLAPAFSFITAFSRISPAQPIRTLIRTTGYKLRPPRPLPFSPTIRQRQEAVLVSGVAGVHQAANILHEQRKGPVPTIVLGGFIPDATEQVFLMRGFLLKHGSIYYLNYPQHGFSIDLLFAQLDDLVEELSTLHGQSPVIFSVSFGAGLVMEWLKRARRAGRHIDLRGLVLISPVACVEDLLAPGDAKPTTLLGRAIKPYVDPHKLPDHTTVDKSRAIFTKMFESGAQNKESLRMLMTRGELSQLRGAVMNTIRTIQPAGACERVQALRLLEMPSSYFSQTLLPLSDAPALILYAEKESSVIADHSPTRFVLESAHRAYFPQSQHKIITNHRGSPVQHASLIFHCFNFLPVISAFYRTIKNSKVLRSSASRR
jgi:alpha-beta hydrolase superfamily lysophospholipase